MENYFSVTLLADFLNFKNIYKLENKTRTPKMMIDTPILPSWLDEIVLPIETNTIPKTRKMRGAAILLFFI